MLTLRGGLKSRTWRKRMGGVAREQEGAQSPYSESEQESISEEAPIS